MKKLDKVLELTNLAMTYEEQGLGTVFVSYSGHTEQIDLRIYKGYWTGNENQDILESVTIYLDGANFSYQKYLKTIVWLQDCLLKKELQSSEFIHKRQQENYSEIF